MNIFDTIILSITQGLAEWLPISSSGHLILWEKWLAIKEASLGFDIFLHLASLLVLLIFFRKEIRSVARDFFGRPDQNSEHHRWGWYIILSTAITALIGYFFYDRMDAFRQPHSVAVFFIVTGILVLATKFCQGAKKMNLTLAVVLGLMQGLAVLPGLSRSGSVIALALILGLNKKEAFEYSFILAIPAIIGAFILSENTLVFHPYMIFGFALTALVSFLALSWLRSIMNRDYFYWFSFYTLILGITVLLLP
ncbi:MAG: undecaprenyl-diphosphatase [Parcubacteria group bacterium]|nr:MAG: undecaprenyl-diphosphatase [Parcubacteria group bacterium]